MLRRIPGQLLAHWRLTVVVGAALVFFLVNVAHFAHQPLRIEENEWPPMARAIFEHGEPVIPFDETHRVRFTPELQVDRAPLIGAWHPPLYLYTLAATMPVLGSDASFTLRGVGIASLLLTCLLLFLVAREIVPRRWPLVGAVASALVLVHPWAIQGSTFLDIDTGIYAALTMLVIYLAIRFGRRDVVTVRHVVLIGLALALLTWGKMTTVIPITGVLVAWWVLTRRMRGALEAAGFVAVGAAAFFATYALWCEVTGVPFSYTFDVTFVQKQDRLFSDSRLTEQAVHWHTAWIMPALLALVAVYGLDLLRRLATERRLQPMDLVYLIGLALTVTYGVLSPTDGTYQGKYAYPGLAPLLLSVTWLILRRDDSERVAWSRLAGAAAVGLLAALIAPDLLTDLHYYLADGDSRLRIVAGLVGAVALGSLLVARQGRLLSVGALAALAAMSVVQSVRSYEADTSPMYPIRDTDDFERGAAKIHQLTSEDHIVLAPKDLGFYLKRRIVEGEDALARGDAFEARMLREREDITVVASDSFGPPMLAETAKVVEECFEQAEAYGSVIIRVRRPTCQ